MKKLAILIAFIAAVCLAAPAAFAGPGKCKWCGSSSYGHCAQSPYKKHEHTGGGSKVCAFCGSAGYGRCPISPMKKHRHGSGNNKCVWCGSTSNGHCPIAPHKRHEK